VEVSRKNLPLGLGSVDNMNPFSVMARLARGSSPGSSLSQQVARWNALECA